MKSGRPTTHDQNSRRPRERVQNIPTGWQWISQPGGALATNGLVALLALQASVRPVSASSLWWDLSRGREVLRGTMTPSRDLLALDTLPEADWLSGLLPFLLYAALGATALMIVRITVALGFSFVLRQQLRGASPWTIVGLVGGTLILCERAFDPGPLLLDLVGICIVYSFANQQSLTNRWRRKVLIGLAMFCVWANLAPHPLIGLLVLAATLGMRNAKDQLPGGKFGLMLVSAGAGCCLTPRGLLTLWDSLRLMVPACFVESWAIDGTNWAPLHRAETPLRVCLFGALACVTLILIIRRDSRFATLGAWGTIQVLAWSSSENLPLAAVWLAFVVASLLAPPRDAVPASRHRSPAMNFLPLAIAAAVVLLASGWTKLGWGVDERLDDRLVSVALAGIEPEGTALADDVRGAGMLAWQRASTIPVQDVPQRALLGGRLAEHAQLLSDLAAERQGSYWREDGTQGGWWIPLMQRKTTLLLIEADRFEVIRGLEPTLWKPLSLDSPVIPYGSTADAVCTRAILEVLKQRHLVEAGPWTYAPPQSSGSQYDRDLFGWGREALGSRIAIRQAKVFRAMDLPRAASKILLHEQRLRSDANVMLELAACQDELAHAEYAHAAHVSLFRRLAAQTAARRIHRAVKEDASFVDSADLPVDLRDAVAEYLNGDLEAAFASLNHGSATQEERYAIACLLIEAGSPEQASGVLETIEHEADNGLRLLAIWLRQQLTFDITDK